jgi:acyl-CoA reductase-like NAD-dependent aldehyde dehydrogenase
MRVPKTIKLYINGAFPRTESGRSYECKASDGSLYANLCDGTRKDLRGAVEAAKAAGESWAAKSAYNRGQILYRIAEMFSARQLEVVACLMDVWGMDQAAATKETTKAIDGFVYYAGFTDKYQQLMGSVNPVSGPHHNFTTPEAVGVVGILAEEKLGLAAFTNHLAAVIASGNTVVAILEGKLAPLLAPLSEILDTSDLPVGVINLLTEQKSELFKHLATHMELQAIAVSDDKLFGQAKKLGIENMKRSIKLRDDSLQLACILDFVEYKTVWHPIGT